MRYLSLFSGIGGFEYAINKLDSECVGFSEIDNTAIQIYLSHYPTHKNLGDITKITKSKVKSLGKIDLVVAGFPCTNLSSLSAIRGNNTGLDGEKSGLFYSLIKILLWVFSYNKNIKFIIENNNSMKKEWKNKITDILKSNFQDINVNMFDNALFGVQSRKRIIWTNFKIKKNNIICHQTWDDILEPIENITSFLSLKMINCLNKTYIRNCLRTKIVVPSSKDNYKFEYHENIGQSRWDIQSRSDNMKTQLYSYPVGKSRPITSGCGGGINILLDRRGCKENEFRPRKFTMIELERLFGLPDNYTNINNISNTKRHIAIGNSVPVFIVEYVLNQI